MALQIISVVLFTVFFSEALTQNFSVLTTVPLACTQITNCTSQREQCSSNTTITYNGISSSFKNCIASCANVSVNVGWMSHTSQCCASDLCNNTADSSNKMTCYTCNDINCPNTQKLECKGEESQCITATGLVGSSTTTTLKGCASKNVCGNSTLLPQLVHQWANVSNVLCCDGNLCNSAQSLTQGAMLLLVPMLPVLFSN